MNVVDRVKAQYNDFSRIQKRIADYIISYPDRACFLSLKELGEVANVTEVTVIKFTKIIGFKSFMEFKKDLQHYIQSLLSPNEEVLTLVRELKEENDDIRLKEIIDVEILALNKTLDVLNVDDIKKAVKLIKNAERIYVAGQVVSNIIVQYFLYRLRLLGLDVVELDLLTYTDISSQLNNVDQNDLIIISSFPKYSKKTVRLSQYLNKEGIKIISFTDRITSPVAKNSDVVFACTTDSLVFQNSITSPISVINILASSLAISLKEELEHNKENIHNIYSFLRNGELY